MVDSTGDWASPNERRLVFEGRDNGVLNEPLSGSNWLLVCVIIVSDDLRERLGLRFLATPFVLDGLDGSGGGGNGFVVDDAMAIGPLCFGAS